MANSIGNQCTKRGAGDRSLGDHDTLKPAGAGGRKAALALLASVVLGFGGYKSYYVVQVLFR